MLGSDDQSSLVIHKYTVMTFLESYNELVKKNRTKSLIKMVLSQKCFQELSVLQPFLVTVFRKNVKQEIMDSKEYKALLDLIQ